MSHSIYLLSDKMFDYNQPSLMYLCFINSNADILESATYFYNEGPFLLVWAFSDVN